MAMFECLVSHRLAETKHFFATAAAYGSRPPRPCRRWVFYCILVAGAACTALSSRSAYERLEWRGLGVGQEQLGVVQRARLSHHASAFWRMAGGTESSLLVDGTLARRQSSRMGSDELPMSSDAAECSRSAASTVTGY